MCLIVNRQEGQLLTDEFITDVANKNPHGWGLMYNRPSDGKVITKKGLELDSFFANFHPIQEKDIPCVIHFRVRTHGPIDIDNCHPFRVANGVYFMHNGTIEIDIPKKDSGKASDTNVFVRDVLTPLLLSVKDKTTSIHSPWFEHFMDAQAKSHSSRFVIMDENGPEFFGNWSKTKTGVWCSNTYGYTVDNPTYTPPARNYGYPTYGRQNSFGDDGYDWNGYQHGASSRAANAANKANALLTQADFKRNVGEDTIAFYQRLGMNKDHPRFKTEGETIHEYDQRMAGKVENLIKLPKVLDIDILAAMAEKDKISVISMETNIYFNDDDAARYLKLANPPKEVGNSVVPFQSQNTQGTNNHGTQEKDTQKGVESQEKSGSDTSNKDGEKPKSQEESQSTSNDDEHFASDNPLGSWVDLVGHLQDKSVEEERAIADALAEEMEAVLDKFEMVAEEDWSLDQDTIDKLSDLIVRGDLVFRYDAHGMSTLSDNTGVLYPDFLSQKRG